MLLAEFDIDRGAQLTYQFPQPLGTDELLLANFMLPDGAEKQLEDWTIFFLNQTPFNTIAPVLALETPESDDGVRSELLYVLNLVRMKHDKSVRRYTTFHAFVFGFSYPRLTEVPWSKRWRSAPDTHSFKYSRSFILLSITPCSLKIVLACPSYGSR